MASTLLPWSLLSGLHGFLKHLSKKFSLSTIPDSTLNNLIQNKKHFNTVLMKAIICTRYGKPDVLKIREIDKPVPRDNEVLVKVNATTVTAGDTRVRAFRVPASFWIPARIALGLFKPRQAVLGMELAGEIEAVGENVQKFKPGDQVFATTGVEFGAYSHYKCFPETGMIALKPNNCSFLEAAAIPIGARTAFHFLKKANIRGGEKVLIYGASGSVGTYAVQIAKYFGADVTAVCSKSNSELVLSLGASRVIDYTTSDFTKNKELYDVIFDTVGKSSFSGCVRSLKPEGAYLHAVAAPAIIFRMFLHSFFSRRKMIGTVPAPYPEELVLLKNLTEAGMIIPVIDREYPFEQIAEAHRYVDTGRKKGNVVIRVNS
jgi:NADPH:quinone reductase-like Zn-dependent oxidoreductase